MGGCSNRQTPAMPTQWAIPGIVSLRSTGFRAALPIPISRPCRFQIDLYKNDWCAVEFRTRLRGGEVVRTFPLGLQAACEQMAPSRPFLRAQLIC